MFEPLSDKALIEAYKTAVRNNLDQQFINMLHQAIKMRNLDIDSNTNR